MMKFMLGEQSEITPESIFEQIGIGTPESRAIMRQALLDQPVVPNQYVGEIIDLGLQAGLAAFKAAVSKIDMTADLASHEGVRQAVGQIGVQLACHALTVISQSMVATLKDNAPADTYINLMAGSGD